MSRSSGFTLIELLLASALCVMLMAGVIAVVADLGSAAVAQAGPFSPDQDDTVPRDAVVGLLRDDIRHAASVDAMRPNEVILTGYGALVGAARQRTHRPVRVWYRLEQIGGRTWLVRRQAALDVLTNRNVQRDLVCCGIDRFELVEVKTAGAKSKQAMPSATQSGDATIAAQEPAKPRRLVFATREDLLANMPVGNSPEYPMYAAALRAAIGNGPIVVGEAADRNDIGLTDQDSPSAPAPIVVTGSGQAATWRLRAWQAGRSEPICDLVLNTPGGAHE